MNLEDLMDVWRSQEAAPLHGVNETLLRLALRQDEAKLQARRRREKWFISLAMAMLLGVTVFFLLIMITPQADESGWDYAVAVVSLAAALLLSRVIYVGYRAQTLRVQGFGESLRDQLKRQLAMIDPFLTFSWADREECNHICAGLWPFGCHRLPGRARQRQALRRGVG